MSIYVIYVLYNRPREKIAPLESYEFVIDDIGDDDEIMLSDEYSFREYSRDGKTHRYLAYSQLYVYGTKYTSCTKQLNRQRLNTNLETHPSGFCSYQAESQGWSE